MYKGRNITVKFIRLTRGPNGISYQVISLRVLPINRHNSNKAKRRRITIKGSTIGHTNKRQPRSLNIRSTHPTINSFLKGVTNKTWTTGPNNRLQAGLANNGCQVFNVNRGDQERTVGNSSNNTSNHTIVRYRRIREPHLTVAISNGRRNHLTYKAKLTQNRQYKLHLNLLPRNLYNNHLTKSKGISQNRHSRAIRVRTRTAELTHNYRYLHHFRATGRAHAPFLNIDNMCIMRLT